MLLFCCVRVFVQHPFAKLSKHFAMDLMVDPELLWTDIITGIRDGLLSLSQGAARIDSFLALIFVSVPIFQLVNRYFLSIEIQEEVPFMKSLACAIQVVLFSWIYQPKVVLSNAIYCSMLMVYMTVTVLKMNPAKFSAIFTYSKKQLAFR